MKAMILAAGRGTRVRPLTGRLPKPMIPIVHKPVMEMLIEHLRDHGFDQIMVNTSYLAPQIEHYFGNGERFGVELAYSFEGRLELGQLLDHPVGSAGALQKIQRHSGFFDDDFVVVCGDAVVDLDLGKLLAFHRQRGAIATLALKQVPCSEVVNYGVAVCNSSGQITAFQEKPACGSELSDLANTGIYIFSPAIFDWIPTVTTYDIGSQLLPELARSGAPIFGCELPFAWYDIGRLGDFYRVTMQALARQGPVLRLPGREIRPGVHVGLNVRADFSSLEISGPVVISGSARIDPGCRITGPALIGANAHLEAGCEISHSIVLEHTRLSGYASYENKVVGADFCFDAEGTVLDTRSSDIGWLFADARSPQQELQHAQRQLIDGWQALQP